MRQRDPGATKKGLARGQVCIYAQTCRCAHVCSAHPTHPVPTHPAVGNKQDAPASPPLHLLHTCHSPAACAGVATSDTGSCPRRCARNRPKTQSTPTGVDWVIQLAGYCSTQCKAKPDVLAICAMNARHPSQEWNAPTMLVNKRRLNLRAAVHSIRFLTVFLTRENI